MRKISEIVPRETFAGIDNVPRGTFFDKKLLNVPRGTITERFTEFIRELFHVEQKLLLHTG